MRQHGMIDVLLAVTLLLAMKTDSAVSDRAKRQQDNSESGSITSFLGQLTSLINSNGGLGPAIQQALGTMGGYALAQQQQHNYKHQQQQAFQPQQQYQQQEQLYQQQFQRPQQPYQPQQPFQQQPAYSPPFLRPNGFLGALSSIARYDDLKCVPRLLCEVTSGSKPGGYDGKDTSLIPFASKDSLIALLTVLNYVDDSPMLGFGRAALLGYTARGNKKACLNAFPTCPKDPDALVDYLNNHNGGFFRFFSSQQQQHYQQYAPQYPQHSYPVGYHQPNRYRPQKKRPYAQPQPYPGQYSAGHQDYYEEARIQSRPTPVHADYFQGHYRPRPQSGSPGFVFPREERVRSGRVLTFPDEVNSVFPPLARPLRFHPDRTGTGELQADLDPYGGFKSVHFVRLQPFGRYVKFRDQRSVVFPVGEN